MRKLLTPKQKKRTSVLADLSSPIAVSSTTISTAPPSTETTSSSSTNTSSTDTPDVKERSIGGKKFSKNLRAETAVEMQHKKMKVDSLKKMVAVQEAKNKLIEQQNDIGREQVELAIMQSLPPNDPAFIEYSQTKARLILEAMKTRLAEQAAARQAAEEANQPVLQHEDHPQDFDDDATGAEEEVAGDDNDDI